MPDDMAAPAVPRTQIAPASTPDPSSPLISAVVLVAVLYFGREVLIPITLAILLSFLLAPVVGLLRWIHLGRVPSVLLAVILALTRDSHGVGLLTGFALAAGLNRCHPSGSIGRGRLARTTT